ncbi:hypothetical protein [Chitinophaga flava]|uniref:Uncharacterized protein n=1 Tax=Chitinophaga flava TaxID=2259036 RepID=A0A365XUD6_9BACT|nr:hypothetical protein [Chitinophaga flava]RBL89986.1 hypothetical protein DF182_26290 [Chitinophaga flava]
MFTQDSGFIRKKDVLNFLKYNHLTDTTASGWRFYPDSDTLGRYYRQPDGNFIACLLDAGSESFETHLLMEVRPNDSIIKAERFIHWNYLCCWNNRYEGFVKCGDYYCLKICETGSGYCGTHVYIFKNVQPQDSLSGILGGYRASFGGWECTRYITSQPAIRGDSLLMRYKLEEVNPDDSIPQPESVTSFEVLFLHKENKWIPVDSTYLNHYELN